MTKQVQIEKLVADQHSLTEELQGYRLAYGLLSDYLIDLKCARRDGLSEYEDKLVLGIDNTLEVAVKCLS